MKTRLWPLAVIIFATFLVYGGTLWHGLVWDDPVLLAQTNRIVETQGVLALFSSTFLQDPVTGRPLGYYRPLVGLLLWLTSRLSPASPAALLHLLNILLHALNGGLLYRFLRRVLPDPRGALPAALLFAVHPVHVESVAFVSGVTDVLAAVFTLAAMLLWAESLEPVGQRGPRRLGGILLFFLLACLSKETALMLPLVILGVEGVLGLIQGQRGGTLARRLLPLALGFAAVVVIAVGLRVRAGAHFGPLAAPAQAMGAAALGGRLAAVPALWSHYFQLLLIPWPLNALYTKAQLAWTPVSVLATGVLGILCIQRTAGGSRPWRLAALLWIAVFLVPVSGIIPIVGAPAAERFLYVPSLGIALLLGLYLGEAARGRRTARAAAAFTAALLLLGGGATISRSRVWKDDLSLFSDVAGRSPQSAQGQNNLGSALLEAGRAAAALPALLQALRLSPADPTTLFNLGLAYEALGRDEEAGAAYRKARALRPAWALPAIQLGEMAGKLQKWPEAIGFFSEAVRLDPRNALAHKDLGLALLKNGETARAREELRSLQDLDPSLARELQDWIGKAPATR